MCFGGSCRITSEIPWIMSNSDCNHSVLGTLLYTYYFLLVYIPSLDMWVSSMVFSSCPLLRNKKQIKIKTTSKKIPGKTASSKWSLTTCISELFIFFFHNTSTPNSILKHICKFGTGMSTIIWLVLKTTVHKTSIYNLLWIITLIFSGKRMLNYCFVIVIRYILSL